jgi:polyhydroxyalkanoate synthesis regulator phasin
MAQRDDGIPDRVTEKLVSAEASGIDDDVEVPDEVEDWVDETKGFERVASVAISTTEPHKAKWFADQAVVAEQTARDHLETFADLGVVASFTSKGVTRYQADEGFIHYREVSRLVEEHTRDELTEQLSEVKESIQQYRDHYEIQTADELRAKIGDEEMPIEEVREIKKSASELDMLRDRLAVLQDAVQRFETLDHQARTTV